MTESEDNFPLHTLATAETAGRDVAADVVAALAAGADPHLAKDLGETAFNVAAANAPVTGRLLTLHWLEQALSGTGSKGLNDISGSHGSTLAQYMAKWLLDDELDGWLEKGRAQGLAVDTPNTAGWTPLTAAAAMGRLATVAALLPYYSRDALCVQTVQPYTAVYNGHTVRYKSGLNALEIAQERMFQDEGASEELGTALWECADMIAAALATKKEA